MDRLNILILIDTDILTRWSKYCFSSCTMAVIYLGHCQTWAHSQEWGGGWSVKPTLLKDRERCSRDLQHTANG